MPEPGGVGGGGGVGGDVGGPGGGVGGSSAGAGARGGGADRPFRPGRPFEGPTESPETIAAVDFLTRQRRGLAGLPSELAARRPRASTILTGVLGASSDTLITRRTLG